MRKETLVGTVFMIAVLLTLFATVAVSGLDIFADKVTWYVYLEDLSGLEVGDDVRVLGYRMGVVRRIRFDEREQVFRISLRMNTEAPIYQGYHIVVRESSALGGRYLAVDPGTSAKGQADTARLVADVSAANVMAGMTDVLEELRQATTAVTEARGTLGRVVMEDDLYVDLKDATASLKTLSRRIESGQGAVGRLINEDEVYVLLRDILYKLNHGDSALAKLMHDESGTVVEDLRRAAESLRSIAAKIDEGQGTLGQLVNNPELYDNTNVALASTNDLMQSIRDAKGTIGKLIKDPEVYDKVKRLLARAVDSIENARDSAPVSAISSFLMGPFQ